MLVNTQNPYLVHIGHQVRAIWPQYLHGIRRLAIICSSKQRHLAQRVGASLETDTVFIEVPDAEAGKTPQVLTHCWNELANAGVTRSDAIAGIGGGAITDLAGFAAATWLRGVSFFAVPTTVLGMVDAAVGGKTGINLEAGKNLVGAFSEPKAVFADLDLLGGLSLRDWQSGFAEILKTGFIADPQILDSFAADQQGAFAGQEQTQELIRRAISVKADVVAADFRERLTQEPGVSREILNYGHTLGHAIERAAGFSLRHGEAVSIGMVFAAEVAYRMGLVDAALVQRHREILSGAGLPISYRDAAWEALRKTMSSDKKSRGAGLRMVVLKGLAQPHLAAEIDESLLEAAFAAIGED
ncbi:MAG: 3-dehydroquinate synthase [Propionibacteriaceae bacterium]|nr:3-dehydroquinate synthase [Propionibacteriaceae bacterium]